MLLSLFLMERKSDVWTPRRSVTSDGRKLTVIIVAVCTVKLTLDKQDFCLWRSAVYPAPANTTGYIIQEVE